MDSLVIVTERISIQELEKCGLTMGNVLLLLLAENLLSLGQGKTGFQISVQFETSHNLWLVEDINVKLPFFYDLSHN